jgi:phage-related protein (TIGR01555 family)
VNIVSEHNCRIRNHQQPENNKAVQKAKGSSFDAFANPLARLGMIGSNNLLATTQYPLTRLTRDYNLMTALYRNSWITKKIINTVADDMCKNWFSITAELTPEQTDRYNKLEQRTHVKEKILETIYWGRLYGGAGAVMLIKGHEEILDEPLDLDDVMPNSFKGLMVLDRWSGIFPGTELITDIEDPEFGMPLYYEIRDLVQEKILTKVHCSRILRFIGRPLPFWEDQTEMHWGASEMEHVFEEMAKHDNTSWNIAALVFQANVLVNKVNGLDQVFGSTDPEMQMQLYNLKTAQNQMRNNNAMMVIGDKDSLETLQYTFSGLDKILEIQMYDVAGAAEIPVTRLFGRSPSGMNATGESDEQYYYDGIGSKQEKVLRPQINKYLPVAFMSEFGFVPDDLNHQYNPMQTPTQEKIAELVGKKVECITKAYVSGLLSQKMGLKELHELSYTTNMFSSITDEDIEAADNSMDNGEIERLNSGFDNENETGSEMDTGE